MVNIYCTASCNSVLIYNLNLICSGKYTKIMDAITTKKSLKFQNHHHGQGMVEFALAIPVVLLLMFGIIEGGRLLFIFSSVEAASREAARYGSGSGGVATDGSNVTPYRDCDGIRDSAKRIGSFAGVTDSSITISYDSGPETGTKPDGCGSSVTVNLGDRIIVDVSVPYKPIVPIVGIPAINIHSSSAFTIVKEVAVLFQTLTAGPLPSHTNTAVASETPTPTNTPTPHGGNPHLTETPTNTPTNTVTPTPGGPCASSDYEIKLTRKSEILTANILNKQASSIPVTKITISWTGYTQASLSQVLYQNASIYSGPNLSTGTWSYTTPGLVVPPNGPGGNASIDFYFTNKNFGDATVFVMLNSGFCYVEGTTK